MKVLGVMILLTITHSLASYEQNYQIRRVYYNESDNVCHYGEPSDQTDLLITFNDHASINCKLKHGTYCDTRLKRGIDQLMPSKTAALAWDDPEEFLVGSLNQEVKYINWLGEVVAVTYNMTPGYPINLNDILYTCILNGDATIQHYGPTPTVQAPYLEMYCINSNGNFHQK